MATRSPPTTRRLYVRLALALATLAGLWWVYLGVVDGRERREWAEACAEADRLDPGWRWPELAAAQPAAPPGRTVVDRVQAAARLLPPAPKNAPDASALVRRVSPPRALPPQVLATLRAAVDANPASAEIDALADSSTGHIPMPPDPRQNQPPVALWSFYDVTKRLLYPRAVLRAEAGDADAALGDVRLMVAVSRPPAEYPNLLHGLIAGSIQELAARGVERTLAQGEPSPAALDATRRLFEAEAGRLLLLPAMRGERAFIDDVLRAVDDGRLSRDDGRSMFPAQPTTGWSALDELLARFIKSDFSRSNAAAQLRYRSQVVEWAKESPDGLAAHDAEWTALINRMLPTISVSAYTIRSVHQANDSKAFVRCAAAALAAEQCRRNTGRWPAALGDLVPNYLAAVPSDPYDLRPLRLARRADGIVIYAVGPDGKDDGGATQSDGAAKGTDEGVRLWDVAKRRRPHADAAQPLPDGR